MGTYRYPTIKSQAVTSRGLGKSDSAALKSLFSDPSAPSNSIPDENSYRKEALEKLLLGEINENLQVGSFDRDFGASARDSDRRAPDIREVATGGGGLPASPWVPNPVSPGAGSTNPADQKEAPAGFGMTPTNSIANDGASTDATTKSRNPKISSENMSLGPDYDKQYVPGKSPATSNAS